MVRLGGSLPPGAEEAFFRLALLLSDKEAAEAELMRLMGAEDAAVAAETALASRLADVTGREAAVAKAEIENRAMQEELLQRWEAFDREASALKRSEAQLRAHLADFNARMADFDQTHQAKLAAADAKIAAANAARQAAEDREAVAAKRGADFKSRMAAVQAAMVAEHVG